MIDRPEMIRLLSNAHDEIVNLRRERDQLAPKAHAYDTIAQMTRLTIDQSPQGFGIDTAWQLKEAVEKLVAEREAERVVQAGDGNG